MGMAVARVEWRAKAMVAVGALVVVTMVGAARAMGRARAEAQKAVWVMVAAQMAVWAGGEVA